MPGVALASVPTPPSGVAPTFERNVGQSSAATDFIVRGTRGSLGISGSGVRTWPEGAGWSLVGAQPVEVAAGRELATRSNYLLGDDPRCFVTNIPHHESVRYARVYPGIDLVHYRSGVSLEHDFVVLPGADPGAVRLQVAAGATLDASGNLHIPGASGELVQQRPVVYQEIEGHRVHVCGSYQLRPATLDAMEVTFDVGPYDPSSTLFIDPVLSFSTYFGGSDQDFAHAVAVDAAGYIYVGGATSSSDFPVANPLQANWAGADDAFVAKLDPSSSSVVWATYLGGSSLDVVSGIAVDASGAVSVAGATYSSDFPTRNAFQAAHASGGGDYDAFVAKIDPMGASLVYSTYLGGTGTDFRAAIGVDAAGNATVGGDTISDDFPLRNAVLGRGGSHDLFLARFDPVGALLSSTYYWKFGGGADEIAAGVAVDAAGDAYLGWTETYAYAAYVAKVDPAGNTTFDAAWNDGTYVFAQDVATDGSGNAYLVGWAMYGDPHCHYYCYDKAWFLSADASGVRSSFTIGGEDELYPYAVAASGPSNVYLAGVGRGSTLGLPDTMFDPPGSVVAKVDGGTLTSGTYLGGVFQPGSGIVQMDLAIDPSGNIHVAGSSSGSWFPHVDPVQPGAAGDSDAFIATIGPGCGLAISKLPCGVVGQHYDESITVAGGAAPFTFELAGGSLPPGLALSTGGVVSGTPSTAGVSYFTVTVTEASGCQGSRMYALAINASAPTLPSSVPDAVVGLPYAHTLTLSGGTPPASFALTGGALPEGLTLSQAGDIQGTPGPAGQYTFTVSATDAYECGDTATFTMSVCGAIRVEPATLPIGRTGQPYQVAFSGSFGAPGYIFSVSGGSLPAGLLLSPSGVLSGTPGAPGAASFVVSATDAVSCTGTQAVELSIDDASCALIVIDPPSLPPPFVGAPYSRTLTASGGTAPYSFTMAGALPPGLQLVGDTISGTPTAAGVSSFALQVTDAAGCRASQSYTLELGLQYVAGRALVEQSTNRVRLLGPGGAGTPTDFYAYGAGKWGVNVAAGSIDGTPQDEIVTAPGPGPVHGPKINAFRRDGVAIAKVNFFAYGTPRYGANAGAASIDADPFAEIVTGPGPGSVFGPHVRAFDVDGGIATPIGRVNFFAFGTLRYGARAGGGDVDGDAIDELQVTPGPGDVFGPLVRGFDYDGLVLAPMGKINFWAFANATHGAMAATGDVDGDAFDEIAATTGPSPSLLARFAGFDYDGASLGVLPGFLVALPTSTAGGRIGAGDVTGDGIADLLGAHGPSPSAGTEVHTWRYSGTSLDEQLPAFDVFPGSAYGVNVAAGAFSL